ncbi:hypothetical protein M7775_11425 [Sporomusa sphaeroides DSM 2875]|nr:MULTISPECIES: hypothetical protein [Sporomusa]MCM0759175.1 hypothetical protein [Sporomusa sphaeroides DSM 2875]HML35257.1 hypothetical protein [Sporomusa sphaeroides]
MSLLEKVCPLCNALQQVEKKCPHCGKTMLDGGALNNYLGPYSPYMEAQSLPFQSEAYCIHLLYCPECDYDRQEILALVAM